jgi:hypothetical protein
MKRQRVIIAPDGKSFKTVYEDLGPGGGRGRPGLKTIWTTKGGNALFNGSFSGGGMTPRRATH